MSVSDSRPEFTPAGDESAVATSSAASKRRPERCWLDAAAGSLALSYGSAAGELAACMNAVGVASRAELTKLELTAPGPNLERVIAGLLGVPLLAGGSYQTRAVGWYRPDGGRLIALCEAEQAERLRGRLGVLDAARPRGGTARSDRRVGGDRRDRPPEPAAAGRARRLRSRSRSSSRGAGHADRGRSRDLLAAARRRRRVGDHAPWIGTELWRRITRAGRPLQICAVGQEALTRYRMLTRRDSSR